MSDTVLRARLFSGARQIDRQIRRNRAAAELEVIARRAEAADQFDRDTHEALAIVAEPSAAVLTMPNRAEP